MGAYVYKPVRWNREAAALWADRREVALRVCVAVLDADPAPDANAFIQPGFYAFQLGRFDFATAIFERGLTYFPEHPMILLSLGSAYSRWHVHDRLYSAFAARPFPSPTPPVAHVGQNEYATDKGGQTAALAAYAERIPALALPRPVKLDFKLG